MKGALPPGNTLPMKGTLSPPGTELHCTVTLFAPRCK